MEATWLNFAVLIFGQLLLFVAIVAYQKRFGEASRFLRRGALIGFFFGLIFDLVFGKVVGLHSYVLGFGAFFLLLNALLSYGLFSATMLLFSEKKPLYLFAMSFLAMLAYETVNQFFHVWTWKFSLPATQFLVTLSVGYFAGSLLVIFVEKVFFKHRP